ncbi:MAG: serine hydrolase [Acidobacteriota bacterium]
MTTTPRFRPITPVLALAVLSALAAAVSAQGPAGASATRWARLDAVIEEGIARGLTPGAVVLVGRGGQVVYEKAYGYRATVPSLEPMTPDTIFDLASLTKVVATTTAVMKLVEEGRLRLADSVASLVPGFDRHGKRGITVRHLLTHVSGLRPDVDLAEPWEGYDTAMDLARAEVPLAAPGERFIYSDINFFVLGDIVARVSGRPLDVYTAQEIFEPLGMRDTGFNPAASLRPRIAPSERCGPMDAWPCNAPSAMPLRGVVHDPTARRMGGVAGHAGLFGTARDLSRFAQMLLGRGQLDGARVLAPLTVARMTAPSTPAGMPSVRGLGWDIDTSYSSNRGDLLPIGSYGHTGFTGGSIWIDPRTRLYVIFLSNRLHPDGKGDVTALRARVTTVAAAAVGDALAEGDPTSLRMSGTDFGASTDPLRARPRAEARRVLAGVDVLARDGFAPLRGKRVGLVTNHTGRASSGASTIDVLHQAPGVRLVALFSPEHGIRGVLDADVPSSTDERTGLPIHSLYGDTRRPTGAMLEGLDALVIDLQDVGARFYTYMSTMGYVLEEAAKRRLEVVVLDRPNPINGWQIEGPAADAGTPEFIAYMPGMPIRHGMTMGELARLFNVEKQINASLTVVPLEGWSRDDWYDATGLMWVNPSPNLRNLNQATLYPGVAIIEYANVSVGRGTDQPFEQVGAPWVDGPRLAARLNARGIPGVRFYPVTFTPRASTHAGEPCQGVFMVITDREALPVVRLGLELAAAIAADHGDRFEPANTHTLLGSERLLSRVRAGEDPAVVASSWAADEARWRLRRAPYLLYR